MFQSTARDFIEKAIEPTARSLLPSIPRATGRRSSAHGPRAARARAPRSKRSSPTTRARRSCGDHLERICSAVGSHAFAARAGHHLAPQPLSSGRNVFEELGDGFTLLCFESDDTDCSAFAVAEKELRAPLKIVRGSRAGGCERYQAAHVLVRPDHFVAWAGSDATPSAEAILRRAIGDLSPQDIPSPTLQTAAALRSS